MSHVLVVSSDVIGDRMAGPGIRAWELGRALSVDHDVTLAAPAPLPGGAPFPLIETRRSVLRGAIANFDVALVQGYSLFQFSSLQQARHLVVDLYDPFVLENLEVHASQPPVARRRIHDYDVSLLRQQLILGDFFLCASERQRHFWIGMLSATNRVNPLTYDSDRALRRLIEVVPFGLPTEPPRKTGAGMRDGTKITADDVVVLWGGGIWNWFDPLTLLRAMARAVRQRPNLKLVFMGTKHPNPSIPQMQMTGRANQLADELQLTGRHVFFRPGWVPYLDRANLLADADVGVSLHFEHVETAYSFRTRVLDYLWAGLPLLLTEGDEMADLAVREGLGIVVGYEDVDAVATALVQLAEQPGLRQTYRGRVLEVARRFRWEVVAQPLNHYCHLPWQAADRQRRRRALRREKGGVLGESQVLLQKAWHAFRTEGAHSLAVRTYRYIRRRM